MPTQVGSTTTDFDNATPTSLTTSYIQAAGSDLLLVVMVGTEDGGATHDTVTFDTVGLTKKTDLNAQGRRTTIWTLVNPNVTTANIVVTLSGAADVGMIATSWQDVHQTTPVTDAQTASGLSTSPSVTVASASGELVLNAVNNGDDGGDPTADTGTEIADVEVTGDFRFHASQQAGAAPNVDMDWTIASTEWNSGGISIQPPAAAGWVGGDPNTVPNANVGSVNTVLRANINTVNTV